MCQYCCFTSTTHSHDCLLPLKPSRFLMLEQALDSDQYIECLNRPSAPNKPQHKRWHLAGHEFVALGWVLEQASPAIARTLRAISDASSAAVVIPEVPGIAPAQLYRCDAHLVFTSPVA